MNFFKALSFADGLGALMVFLLMKELHLQVHYAGKTGDFQAFF